jgi:hypothetical protein
VREHLTEVVPDSMDLEGSAGDESTERLPLVTVVAWKGADRKVTRALASPREPSNRAP